MFFTKRPKLLVVDDDPGRLVLPLRIESAQAKAFLGPTVIRFVPAHMGAAEFEWGGPEALFQQHAESARSFYMTEICAHGAWLDTFVSAPRKLNIEKYKVELKRMALGLSYHHRDPGIVGHAKFLAGRPDGRASLHNVWFDMHSKVMFTFDVEAAKHIVVGPGARLNRFPVEVEQQAA